MNLRSFDDMEGERESLPKELQMAYDFGEMVMSESSLSMKWLGVSQV